MDGDVPQDTSKRKPVATPKGAKAKRQRKKNIAVEDENGDSSEAANDVDPSTWPQEFKQLDQVYQSLNTVYTFCCTRKHFATTFESIKTSVESLTHRLVFPLAVPLMDW